MIIINIQIKIFAITLLSLLSYSIGFSQCWDFRDKSVERIKQYYAQSQFDSINLVINDWNFNCEMNEELFRLSILNAIELGREIEPILNNNTIGYLLAYETKQTESLLPYYHALTYAGLSNDGKLKEVTKRWSMDLISKESLNPLEKVFLRVYSSDDANPAWDEVTAGSFPHPNVQESFNKIIDSSNNLEDHLSPFGGNFFHPESTSQALEFGLAYDRILGEKIKSFGGAVRFGTNNQLGDGSIATNSLFLFYDYGKYIRRNKANYQLSLVASYSAYFSDFGESENKKRSLSVIGLGVNAGIDFKGKKPDKWGLYLRYIPVNIKTSDVGISASFLTLGIKYRILKSDVSRQLLHPIGYFD